MTSAAHVTRRTRTNALILVAAMLTLMWLLEVVDSILGGSLDGYGIIPRTDEGLTGIPAAPFLHVGFGHLISNSLPFLAMGATIAIGGLARLVTVTVVVALFSGFGTWLVASPSSVHLGASGVVFGYASYLISRGLFNRDPVQLGIGLIVGALFGGALIGGLVPQTGISWQAHLFGAIGGVMAAWILARRAAAARVAAGPAAMR